jgi:TIR domain
MSDIFISYDNEDRARVARLVEIFKAHGWSVWWDQGIQTGEAFAQVIEREIEKASAVVVAWTTASVRSEWVRAEVDEGWKRGRLFPLLLDPVEPPMPYRQIQAADLVDWQGDPAHAGLQRLTTDLAERIGTRLPHDESPQTPNAVRPSIAVFKAALAAAALLLIAGGAWYMLAWPPKPAGKDAIDVSAPAIESPAGHWRATVTYPDGASFEERFTFAIDGTRLTGTASMRGYGYRREILDGVIDGDRLSFRSKGNIAVNLFGSRDVSYRYEATAADGELHFTLRDESSGDPAITFSAARISAEAAARIATGGTRPRLSGMSTGNLYSVEHVRAVFAAIQHFVQSCYAAAEFDPIDHQHVVYDLTLTAAGELQDLAVRPSDTSLDTCMKDIFADAAWGPTDTGAEGTLQLTLTARLPWNP